MSKSSSVTVQYTDGKKNGVITIKKLSDDLEVYRWMKRRLQKKDLKYPIVMRDAFLRTSITCNNEREFGWYVEGWSAGCREELDSLSRDLPSLIELIKKRAM